VLSRVHCRIKRNSKTFNACMQKKQVGAVKKSVSKQIINVTKPTQKISITHQCKNGCNSFEIPLAQYSYGQA